MTANPTKPDSLPLEAQCLTCGYALRDLSRPQCPECGRAFDPANPLSYRVGPGKLRRYFKGPPAWQLSLLISVYTLVYVLGDSSPGGLASSGTWIGPRLNFFGILLLVAMPLVMMVAIVDYLPRLWFARANAETTQQPASTPTRQTRIRWIITPVCLGLVLSVWSLHWPLKLRFGMSLPAFEATHASLSNGGTLPQPAMLGSYRVMRLSIHSSGFFATGYLGFEMAGFRYQADDKPWFRGQLRVAPHWYVAFE